MNDPTYKIDPPENIAILRSAILTFLRYCLIFTAEHNFCTALATVFSFEVAWIQTLTVVSCDCQILLYDMFDQYKNWPIFSTLQEIAAHFATTSFTRN